MSIVGAKNRLMGWLLEDCVWIYPDDVNREEFHFRIVDVLSSGGEVWTEMEQMRDVDGIFELLRDKFVSDHRD